MTTNKVCGKGKCKFTDEFCASGDCPYDTDNVANNVAQRNSQDLTEQYKKGELEQGWYYVKNEFGNIFISEYSKDYDFIGERVISGFFTEVSEIIEIICEVPSYEQWQQMKAFCEGFNALDVAEENRELKELLKEWIHYYPIVLYEHEDTLKTKDIIELYDRTREVLK